MRLTLTYIILSLSSIYSCNKSDNYDNITFKRVFDINTNYLSEAPLFFSEIFSEVNYIKLETQKDNLFSNFRRLIINDDKFYLFSRDGLYIFNQKGDYLFKLVKSGRGPGEVIDVSDIHIENNSIEVMDIFQKKIVRYDKNGNFIDEFRYEFSASSFCKIENDTYAFYLGNRKHKNMFENGKDFNILIYKKNNNNIQNAFYPVTPFRKNLHYLPLSNFHKHKNLNLFQDVFNDTIYKLTSATFTPYYYIDFKDKKVVHSNFKDGEGTDELIYKIFNSGFAQLLYLNESENFVVFDYVIDKERYIAIFDKESTKMKIMRGLINDLEKDHVSYPVYLKDDMLYFYYESYEFLKRYYKNENDSGITNSHYLNIINSTSVSDNPIIVEAKINHF